MGVGAGLVSAFVRYFQHFREIGGNLLFFQINEPESSYSGGVYYKTSSRERIYFIECGGVTALKVAVRNFCRLRIKRGIKTLYQG